MAMPDTAADAGTALQSFLASLHQRDASAETFRQRRLYLTEFLNYAARELGEDQVRLGMLLDPDLALAWLAYAETGATRQVLREGDPRAPIASQAARASSFNMFAQFAGSSVRLHVPPVDLQERLSPVAARQLIRMIADTRPPDTRVATWERTAALAALVVATGASLGEAASLVTSDLVLRSRTPRVRVAGEWHALDELTTATLQRWLDRRREITRPLEGGVVKELWVTIKPGRPRHGEPADPAGMPAALRTLRAAHRAMFERLGVEPVRLGLLRTDIGLQG